MATVTGPLHSQSATGQLGKTLIYQPSRGQNVVRAYGKPNWTAHPPTIPQLAVQAFTKLIMQHWETIPTLDQATWDALAEPNNISRVNAYCIKNWRRHRGDEPLLDGWPNIYSTIVAAVVTPSYPALDPDCAGDYQRIADFFGYAAYRRIGDNAFSIYHDTCYSCYVLDAVLGTWKPEAGWSSQNDDPESTWSFEQEEGVPIVNII